MADSRTILFVVLLQVCGLCAALGDTQTTLGDRSGEGSTPFTALAGSPEANLYNGTVSAQVPIQIPPGRKNMTPAIALVYSSAGGPSPFGYGWNLPIGSIERSTKWGVPTCEDEHTDDFVLSMPGGVHAELVAEEPGGDVYRPRVEEAYVEAVAYKGQTSDNYWVVRDRAGLKYTFGGDGNAKVQTGPAFLNETLVALFHARAPSLLPGC